MKKGSLIIISALLIGLVSIVSAVLFLSGGNLHFSATREKNWQSFNTAQAGLSKGIWYVCSGGALPYSSSESFDNGSYTINITSGEGLALITAEGTFAGISKTLQQQVAFSGLPAAFSYSAFSNSALNLSGSVAISGDIYANGNITLGGSSSINGGSIYHPAGTSVIYAGGSGSDGGIPATLPEMPDFNNSYYLNEISEAAAKPGGSFATTSDIYLASYPENTLYVNGSLFASGNIEIHGPGNIVVTGATMMSGRIESASGDVNLISAGPISMSGTNLNNLSGMIIYSSSSIALSLSGSMQNCALVTPGSVSLSGNTDIVGLVYAGTSVSVSGSSDINGSLVSASISALSGNVGVVYNPAWFASLDIPGFSSGSYSLIKGSWKQL